MRVRVLVLVVVLLIAGCARPEPSIRSGDLLREYAEATEPVKNDRFDLPGTGADRMANLLAYYGQDQLVAALFTAWECGEDAPERFRPSTRCSLTSDVTGAVAGFAGEGSRPYGRTLLVKHEDGALELLTVYIARRADGRTRLIDRHGDDYADLDDYRAGNNDLDADDTVLTLRDIASVPGGGDLVVVSGHTPALWPWFASGAAAVALVAVVVLLMVRRRRAAAENAALLARWDEDKP